MQCFASIRAENINARAEYTRVTSENTNVIAK